MSRRSWFRWQRIVASVALTVMLAVVAPTAAQAAIGGRLFATGGTVDIVVQPATSDFVSQLFLQHPDGTRELLALNTEVGKTLTIGPFSAGRELVFGITVLKGGATFLIGPASRNPDGIAHVDVTRIGVRTFVVGFEDLFGGGDRDYDDTVFRFSGNLAPSAPPPPTDAPSPPDATAPDPPVPALTIREARSKLPRLLRKEYGRRYSSRRGALKRTCYRRSSEKVRCRFRWNVRRHRYSGIATLWRNRADPDVIRFKTTIRRTRR
jgi:hypothetical protein